MLDFFQTSSRNLLAAEAAAGVGHHVTLSVVGAERLPESGYMRAKVAQEDLVKAGPIPYTIVRATQFFEFIGRIADSGADGDTIRLSPALVQPEAADDVASTLADVAVGAPLNDTVELAGPEAFRLDELAQRVLNASGDPATGDGRRSRPLLRRRAGRPVPHPRRRRTHRPNPLRGLAQPGRQVGLTPTRKEGRLTLACRSS